MKVIKETTHEDGSSWAAVVEVSAVLFRATYVAATLSVGMVPYKRPPLAPRWGIKSVKEWAEERIQALSPEWNALHAAMYGVAKSNASFES